MYEELKLAVSPVLFAGVSQSVLSPDGAYYHISAGFGGIGSSVRSEDPDVYIHYNQRKEKIGRSVNFANQMWSHYDAEGKQVGRSMHMGFGSAFHHYDNDEKEIGYSLQWRPKAIYTHFVAAPSESAKEQSAAHDCFVATACFDNANEPAVIGLRAFRDHTLKQSALGRLFIAAHEEIGPRAAEFVAKHPEIKPALRKALNFISQNVA